MREFLKFTSFSIMMAAFILFGIFYLKKSYLDDPNIIWPATLFVAIPLILVLVPISIFYYKNHGLKYVIAFPIMMTMAVIFNNFINSLWISTAIAVMFVICYSILNDKSIRASWSMAAAIRKNNPGKAINIGKKILTEKLNERQVINIKINLINAYFQLKDYPKVKEILVSIDISKVPYYYKSTINFWQKKIAELIESP